MNYSISDKLEDIKVSVYCLAYNHEKYIKKALDGFIMQQTNFRYEVIVHDDASTDKTPDIIKEYAEKYPDIIKPIFQKENQLSKGINISATYIFPKIRGKYIASCEGDDYWNDKYKLQKQFDVMEEHPECSLSTHKVQFCNEDGTFNPRILPGRCFHINKSDVIKEDELVKCYWIYGTYPFHTSSYFFRRSILDIDLDYPRDIGILRKCLIKGSVYYFNEPMSIRRLGAVSSWTTLLNKKGTQEWYKLILRDNEAEERFDQYTNYKYHDYIQVSRLKKFISYARWTEFHKEIKSLLIKYDLSPWKIRKKITAYMFLELQLKYILVMYMPKGYVVIRKMWDLLIKRKQN
ncbi:MAG: glycosyltransferase [Clostridiales bacterium]|nr:glycosyltransferase [Clostridiales bacterium]